MGLDELESEIRELVVDSAVTELGVVFVRWREMEDVNEDGEVGVEKVL